MNACQRCGKPSASDPCFECVYGMVKILPQPIKLDKAALDLIINPYLGDFSNFYLPDDHVALTPTGNAALAGHGISAKELQEAMNLLQTMPSDEPKLTAQTGKHIKTGTPVYVGDDGKLHPAKVYGFAKYAVDDDFEQQGMSFKAQVTFKASDIIGKAHAAEPFPLTTFDKQFLPSIGVSGW